MHPQKGFLAIGLQKLLLCFFILVSVIPVLFLGCWVYSHALEAELTAVEEKHLLLADHISSTLTGYANDLKAVFIAKSESAPEPATAETEVLLRSANIEMLALVRPGGSLSYCLGNARFLPAGGLNLLLTEKRRAYARPGDVVISRLMLNVRQIPTLYLIRVTQNNGLAIAAVNTTYFKKIQQRITFGEGGHGAIIDSAGQVIAHPNRQWESSVKDLNMLKPIQLMQQQERGVAEFYSPAAKTRMIAGYAISAETGWGVMVPQPYSEVVARAMRTKFIALCVSVAGLLLAVLVSWRLTHYLLSPIQVLMEASQSLEAGKKIERLPVDQRMVPKEMYRLLRAFDHMAAEVLTVRSTLEQRVEERTQALSAEVDRRKQLEEQLRQQATHDLLTGLPNRRLLEEQLQSALALSRRSQLLSAVLFLDLDRFKPVNDTYGHPVGDELLIQVSQRLTRSLRDSDSVFRIGGDEFVILIYQVESTEAVKRLSDKILMVIKEPFCVKGHEVTIGGSIGIKVSDTRRYESLAQILSEADTAMYRAKEKGNCAILYEEWVLS